MSLTTGVYEPEDDDVNEELADDKDEDDYLNTNNNADDKPNDESSTSGTNKKIRSAKYRVAPKPPTCGLLVVLYGERGKTQTLPLKSSVPSGAGSFQPGCADDFKVLIFECHCL